MSKDWVVCLPIGAAACLAGCQWVLGIRDVPVPADAGDAAVEASSSTGFTLGCGAAVCDGSVPVCCLSSCGAAFDSFCAPDAGACTSSCVITVTCDRASDCPMGTVCCGAYDSLNVTLQGASCQPISQCKLGNHRVFCASSDPQPCPSSATCGVPDAGEPYNVCYGL